MVLAVFTLFAIWLDPAEPQRFAALTYGMLVTYVVYAAAITAGTWRTAPPNWFVLATHLADIAVFAFMLVLTQGPASPLFVFCVFSLFCGALRWGSRGAIATAALVVSTYVGIGIYASRIDDEFFELNRFIIRVVYLGVVSALLVFLGRHEERMRADLVQLAGWPRLSGEALREGTEELLRYAMGVLDATHGVLVWESGDEPWLHVRACSPSGAQMTRYSPTEMAAPVAATLSEQAFLTEESHGRSALLADGTSVPDLAEPAVHPHLAALLPAATLSAPFRADNISGRVLFAGVRHGRLESLPLTAIVARELGVSIEQLHASERSRDIAISEERIRLARDLHDGVLQALTGVRLEIQTVARDVEQPGDGQIRDRLLAIERAIALEQRELRSFIAGLKPYPARREPQSGTATRLQSLVERTERQWQLPVALRIAPPDLTLSDAAEQALSLIINEAIVNAAKHAHPSRVSVDIASSEGALQVVVADDGRGFPFRGRFDHGQLVREQMGPVSLRDRLTAMGGALAIES
ncbi:MAG TPA: histidine kinase, partial [Vicinamibacterales bacterium]|nr:histidine kinase [Vicinamibacterales bacterium]